MTLSHASTWRGASIVEFRRQGWRFGTWRCPPTAEAFRDVNVSGADALLVFPRLPVRVRHAGHSAFLAARRTVVQRNPHGEYRLEAVVPDGDVCTWVAVRVGGSHPRRTATPLVDRLVVAAVLGRARVLLTGVLGLVGRWGAPRTATRPVRHPRRRRRASTTRPRGLRHRRSPRPRPDGGSRAASRIVRSTRSPSWTRSAAGVRAS
jgi:hypothetical protein